MNARRMAAAVHRALCRSVREGRSAKGLGATGALGRTETGLATATATAEGRSARGEVGLEAAGEIEGEAVRARVAAGTGGGAGTGATWAGRSTRTTRRGGCGAVGGRDCVSIWACF